MGELVSSPHKETASVQLKNSGLLRKTKQIGELIIVGNRFISQ